MGELVHPLFADEIPVYDTSLSIQTEILTLMDALRERMGIDAYCQWLARETPAAWVIDTPYSEIGAALKRKYTEVTPAGDGRGAAGEGAG